MKNIIAVIIACLVLASCKRDPLDITPDGRMSLDDVFKTELQTEAYLNAVYLSVPTYFNNYNGWAFLAGITDDGQDAEVGNFSGNMASAWVIGSLTPSSNPMAQPFSFGRGQDRYTTFWSGIRNANVFLERAPNVSFADPSRKNRAIAEARLLRAFFYFELIKQFGPMPVVTEPFDPAFDYTKLMRPTFQACIDFIAAECDEVIGEADLPVRIKQEAERGRFTKAVAYTLKSEALLYNASPLWNTGNDVAKWSAAAVASKQGLDALVNTGEYALASNYGDYFLVSSDIADAPRDRETIFEIKDGALPLTTTGLPSKEGSWMLGATPTQELVDSYDMQATGEPAILGYEDEDHLKPIINTTSGYDEKAPYVGRDPRFYATVWYNGASYDNINGKIHTVETFIGGSDQLIKTPPNRINTHTGYYLRKFVDPKLAINQTSAARFKKYRLAELYLNFAEAENEANGPTAQAYAAVNAVRKRAQMPDLTAGLTQDQFRTRIRKERRVEFAWEEHRFWDVRRWKILSQADKLVTGMEIRGGSGGSGIVPVANAGFENGETGWFFNGGASIQAISGHTSAHVVVIADGGQVGTTLTGLTPNTTYEVAVTMLVQAGNGYMGAREFGAANEVLTMAAPEDGVKVQKARFTTGANSTTAVIFSWWPNGAQGMVDDFSVVKVGGNGGSEPVELKFTRFVTERRNAWQDRFLIFPIPLSEVSIIPDFSSNQNPGW